MFRNSIIYIAFLTSLVACGDGRGSNYSSQRAQTVQPNFIPITPGATPVASQSINGLPAQPAPAVLTQPIAITPGARPVDVNGAALPAGYKPSVPADTPRAPVVTDPARAASAASPRPDSVQRYARGDIYTACRDAGRSEATDQRCGCVQWVADQTLTSSQQQRGAGYFVNQQGLQDTRQSDGSANERFWSAWKTFGQQAGLQCRNA